MNYTVYIIYSVIHDIYYVGQTNDVDRRLYQHNQGLSKYTKPYIPWKLILTISKNSRSEAIQLEKKIKNLSKNRIIRFIEKYRWGQKNIEIQFIQDVKTLSGSDEARLVTIPTSYASSEPPLLRKSHQTSFDGSFIFKPITSYELLIISLHVKKVIIHVLNLIIKRQSF